MTDALLTRWDEIRRRFAVLPAVLGMNGEAVRTFDDVEKYAEYRAGDDVLRSLPARSVVALQIGNHADWPAMLLACLRRKLVVLPLETTMNEGDLGAALELCHAAALATASGEKISITLREACAVEWGSRPPSLLKLTSGTTAAPRAIRFQSAQILADADQICDSMGITERDVNFGVVPVSHSYGLSNIITPLLARGVPFAISRDRMPRAIIDGIAGSRATVFPGMPVFFQALCDLEGASLPATLRLCISAGAPLPLQLAQRFREKFGQPIHSFYGSSECGGICYDAIGVSDVAAYVGTPMGGVALEFLDEISTSTRIRVSSAAVGDGYFPEPDAERLDDEKFTPDDLLAKAGGGFRVDGRVSDLINVAGKKVNPAEVEAHLLQFQGVREVVVFARESTSRNQEVAACIVTGTPVAEAELLAFCRSRMSSWQVPKRLFFVDVIPVSERGKTSRRALGRQFA